MNKKVETILQDSRGIIPCSKDPDVYNVCSFSSDYRIVDMLIFECTCPSKDKYFCSHIRAVSKKHSSRYNRELVNIYCILNDVNLKNSLASCVDMADNHYNLLLRSVNHFFHFRNFLELPDSYSLEAKQRFKRVLSAILKVLSSISWRHHTIKTKDKCYINSLNYADNARSSIETDSFLNSLNRSLLKFRREDYSSAIEFLKCIESETLEEIGVYNGNSVINIIEKIFSEGIVSNANKEILINGIIQFFSSINTDFVICDSLVEKVDLNHGSLFKSVLFEIKNYEKNSNLTKETIDAILIEEFGFSLEILGIDDKSILKEISKIEGFQRQIPIISALSLVINNGIIDRNYRNNLKRYFQSKYELVDIIHSAPIMVDLFDYLFWHSSGSYEIFGDLIKFIEDNYYCEKLSKFIFLKFSKVSINFKADYFKQRDSQICICKIVKPNNQTYSETQNYYISMLESIASCDGTGSINYFLGGSIQEKGTKHFIELFPIKMLIEDLRTKNIKNFDVIEFHSSILNACPPILISEVWNYFVEAIEGSIDIDIDKYSNSISEYLFRSNMRFALHNFIRVTENLREVIIPFIRLEKIFEPEVTPEDKTIELVLDNDVISSISNLENEYSTKCNDCLNKTSKIIENKQFILSLQKRFGLKQFRDEKFREIVENFSKIINRSCESLSTKLYSKPDHFIFELIQNADDNSYCTCIGGVPTLVFVFHEFGLFVINNEKGFSKKDVESICDIGNSSKISNEGKIGRFGIGFKSVFSITDTPYIFSNDYCFMFNINSEYSSYICPEWVDNTIFDLLPTQKFQSEFEFEASNYNTKFWLPYKNGNCGDININENLILFTNKLRRIKLVNSQNIIISRKDISISDDVIITVISREVVFHDNKKRRLIEESQFRSFLLFDYSFRMSNAFSNRKNKITIGIEIKNQNGSLDGECENNKMQVFSYLPIRSYGFKFIIQADFDLTSSRESISTNSNWNALLRENIPGAFLNTIKKINTLKGFDLFKQSFINIFPSTADVIDEYFLPVVQRINQIITFEPCIYTFNRSFALPNDSVYFCKESKIHEMISKLFPELNEFSYLLNKYPRKWLAFDYLLSSKKKIFFEEIGIVEFNIDMMLDIIHGIIFDYSYFGRQNEWYYNLFLLIDHLINLLPYSNTYIKRLQNMPLFLSEENKYIEPLFNKSKKQLYLVDQELQSISKLGIHFINRNFILEMKNYFKHELTSYNKIINFINSLGINFITNEEYIEIISNSLSSDTLSIDDHIYFTSIVAKSNNRNQFINKPILAVNSKGELLPLSPKYFHLFDQNNKYSITEGICSLISIHSKLEKYLDDFSCNKFSSKYLEFGNCTFWNSFFSEYGITILPFYFEEIQINSLVQHKEFLLSSKNINHEIIIEHLESMALIDNVSLNNFTISDYYCHGIESLATVMNESLNNTFVEIEYIHELLVSICNRVVSCIHDFWDDLQKYWTINIHNILKISSYVKIQFSNYPIFTSLAKLGDRFVFQSLTSAKYLTVFYKSEVHDVISDIVGFICLDITSNLDILSEALSCIIEVDIDYLCKLIIAIQNPKIRDICLNSNFKFNANSYMALLGVIISKSKRINSAEMIEVLRDELVLPVTDGDSIIWENIKYFYWDDEDNILPNNYSLFNLFSNIYPTNVSIQDIFKFFLLIEAPEKPNNCHYFYILDKISGFEQININSELLLTYMKIISHLFLEKVQISESVKLPLLVNTSTCIWMNIRELRNRNICFSDNVYHYYFYIKCNNLNREILWSPIFYLFLKHESFIVNNLNVISNYVHHWNLILKNILNLENNIIHFRYNLSIWQKSSLYVDMLINVFGPLYEESIKGKITSRKNWNELIFNDNISFVDSNIKIKYRDSDMEVSSYFDEGSNKLYIKRHNDLKDSDLDEIAISILLFISSFFTERFLNIKFIDYTKTLIGYVFNEFSIQNDIDWSNCVVNWIRKLEIEKPEYKIDLRYFLFSDYVDDNLSPKNQDLCVPNITIERINGKASKMTEIGKVGEKAAYNYLKKMYERKITLNEVAIKWINETEESGLPYDIIIDFCNNEINKRIYIEVKSSSKKERNYFYITSNEWQFAQKEQNEYWIIQVLGVRPGIHNRNILEYRMIKNPYEYWRSGNLQMLLLEI
ncbi:superfamily I helicase [Cryptosporidium felis]|nr:superfamily I helicase [Cryptosporidium felis]